VARLVRVHCTLWFGVPIPTGAINNTGNRRRVMDETTNEGTVLGGRHWKIIRTDRTLPANDVHAIRHGDDLHVSWTLFDAMQEIFGADEPDRSDPEGTHAN